MRRLLLLAALTAGLTTAAAPAALAHQGNPNYRSVIDAVTPKVKGVSLDVLNLDDRLALQNTSGRPVVVQGYTGEPYVRILGDGTVQVNKFSSATYINGDRTGKETAPAFTNGRHAPVWQTVDKTGRYQWHDHRIHYMAAGTPPQVKDKSKRTVVFPWKVPISVGAQKGAITGTLFWQPKDSSGPPAGAIAALLALVLLGGGAVVVVRRRRRGDGPDAPADGDRQAPPEAPGEAW